MVSIDLQFWFKFKPLRTSFTLLYIFSERETELLSVKQQSRRDLDNLQFDHETLKRQKASLQSELDAANTEISGLKKTVAELTSSQAGLSGELNCMKVKICITIFSSLLL